MIRRAWWRFLARFWHPEIPRRHQLKRFLED
jgi:hypothetical protein